MLNWVQDTILMRWTEKKPDFTPEGVEAGFHSMGFLECLNVLTKFRSRPVIVLQKTIMKDIIEHLQKRNVEMGGLLLGRVFQDVDCPSDFFVTVEKSVQSSTFSSTSVSLEMAADVWNAAREQGAEGQYVIGWYHSHPNLGAFFSGTDRHTQRSFFNQRHSVGLVVDPIRNEQKFFMGPESDELPVEHTIQL